MCSSVIINNDLVTYMANQSGTPSYCELKLLHLFIAQTDLTLTLPVHFMIREIEVTTSSHNFIQTSSIHS